MLQKELAKRLKARYDTKMDGSGWLEVSSDGIPLCRIKYNGQFLSNADQNLSDESKALGSRTVMSGSVSRSKNDPSQSLQMIERPLLTPDELKSLPKGDFIGVFTVLYGKISATDFVDVNRSFVPLCKVLNSHTTE